jgi:hypothetical protein
MHLLFLLDFDKHRFFKKAQTSDFNKIHPGGAEFFYAEGQMDKQADLTKLIVAFRNFANMPKMKDLVCENVIKTKLT